MSKLTGCEESKYLLCVVHDGLAGIEPGNMKTGRFAALTGLAIAWWVPFLHPAASTISLGSRTSLFVDTLWPYRSR